MTEPLIDANAENRALTICLYCAHENHTMLSDCAVCGKALGGEESTPAINPQARNRIAAQAALGRARQAQHKPVVIHLNDENMTLVVQPAQQTMLGRRALLGKTRNQAPGIDLTPYGAFEQGVSRIHAAINRNRDELTLVDLGSANGTFVNGEFLQPYDEHPLHDGDEIVLGTFGFRIYFD